MRSLSLALAALALAAPARAADKVTLDDLLKQMTDLSKLAEYPDPPYVSKQFSSYDRASEAPGNEAWYANADRGFMLYDGVVKEKTAYFKSAPKREGPEDGFFAAGTKVGISPTHKPVGDFVWAYSTAADGRAVDGKIPQGYIDRAAFTPDPQGHVLAEMDGPGCVVNVWSADPDDAGKVRIYLDDAKEPVIEAPLTQLLGGKWKTMIDGKETTPFPDPIACERSRGYNLYFPIAYAKHCKIVADKPDLYYHVDYRAYPKGTEVETFSFGALAKHAADVSTAAKSLAGTAAGKESELPDDFTEVWANALKPGERNTSGVQATQSGEAITHMHWRFAGENLSAALRGALLKITFDGAKEPQVCCPLGDFFGTSPGASSFASLPFSVIVLPRKELKPAPRSDVLAEFDDIATGDCRWTMPYGRTAQLEIENKGKQKIAFECYTYIREYPWTDRSMHFHAKWRTADMKTRPFHDWTYCDLKGKGVFVGDMLSVMNPVGAWWGEGDEKIFVDGEKFPSWFGTGSEDYFGYAWSNPEPFSHPYHNQTRCDGKGTGATFGLTSVNRFHVLDAIPFEKSFRFDMEVWHWDPNVTVNYAATSYWYARPGATDDFEPVDAKVLQTIPAPPPPFKIAGALEAEALKVLGKSGDFLLSTQAMREFGENKWSGDAQLWARPTKAGEWADLALPVPADGVYHVVVYMTKARDYGVVQFSLDGKPLGKPIDGFEPEKVVSTGAIDLGTVELKKGREVLRVEVAGTNEKSVGVRFMWGLDCVVLKPAAP